MPPMNKTAMFVLSALLIATPKTAQVEAAAPSSAAQSADLQNIQINLNDLQPVHVESFQLSDVTIGVSKATESAPVGLKGLAEPLVAARFGTGQFAAFNAIVTHESGWNLQATNPSSGAYGLGQALPATKIKDRSPLGQIKWVIDYIAQRYGTPAHAWAIWQIQHWY